MSAMRPTPFRLRLRRQRLQLEALVWVIVASLAIRVLPFRAVAAMARSVPSLRASPERAQTLAAQVRQAVQWAAARLPWRTMCFEMGLATHLMLRLRGVACVLNYGVQVKEEGGLGGHVWITLGDVIVIGAATAHQHVRVARFPELDT